MDAPIPTPSPTEPFLDGHLIDSGARFLQALFEERDTILFRPIESWTENGKKISRVVYKNALYRAANPIVLRLTLQHLHQVSAAQRANAFFGVCPRFGNKGKFDLAWQIRSVRALWADIDHVGVEEARERVTEAALPQPSIVVNSGNGAHLYWLLDAPFLIDDTGNPAPVQTEWIEKEGKRKAIRFIVDEFGERIGLENKQLLPKLSPKAQYVQDVLSGLAARIGGDHTTDLSRLLRLPGTLNRKDERSGKTPIPCELVELRAERRYSISIFEPLANNSPDRQRREKLAKIPLPAVRNKQTGSQADRLTEAIVGSQLAEKGDRSDADFSTCCEAIRCGVDKDSLWSRVKDVGKFHEAGEIYFARTWEAAVSKVREDTYERTQRKAQSKKGRKERQARQSATSSGKLPTIQVDVDEARVADEAIEALASQQNVYQRGGVLAHVVQDPPPPPCLKRAEGGLRMTPLPQARLRELLTLAAVFIKDMGEDGLVPCHPPDWLVKAIDARGQWPRIRRLEGIVESPVLLADGSILQSPGYDLRSGLYFCPGCRFPEVPDQPSREEALRGRDDLLEIIADFPLKAPEHRAACLAAILTPAARYSFDGPCPLFAIDANVRGSGKTLLADAIGVIYTGRRLARTSPPKDDEEARKKITSIALAGELLVLIDNVTGTLGCASLDAALTATTWSDRILGKNQMTGSIPLSTIWFATGNNMVFAADTSRRALHIRLESNEESPEERTGFQHADLLDWVRKERGRLASAAVTVLRAYLKAGQPDLGLKEWGSFEAWSRIVRHAVVWCDMADPAATRNELSATADRDAQLLRLLLTGWEQADPNSRGMTVVEAINRSTESDCPALRAAFAEMSTADKPLNPRSVGMKLHHYQRRVCGDRRFVHQDSRNGALWRVEKLGQIKSACSAQAACDTSGTSGTNFDPHIGKSEYTHAGAHAHIEGAGNSPASGASPSASVRESDEVEHSDCGKSPSSPPDAPVPGRSPLPANGCDQLHTQPERWTHRGIKAYCPTCDKFMGYLRGG